MSTRQTPSDKPAFDRDLEAKLLGRFQEARLAYEKAAMDLAFFYSRSGEQKRAIEILAKTESVTQDPERKAYLFLSAGQLSEQLRDFHAALSFYYQTLSLEPTDKRTWYLVHNNIGFCLNQLGRHKEAERYCRDAISIDGKRQHAHKNLGIALEGQGMVTAAAEAYITAVLANPTDNRALAYLERLVQSADELAGEMPDIQERLRKCRAMVAGGSSAVKDESDPPSKRLPTSPREVVIAILDDDKEMVGAYTAICVDKGYRFVWFERKEVFLEHADEVRADLVISDIRAPGMDGFEFLRRFKTDPRFSEVPVIVVSGFLDRKRITLARQLGASKCIAKPFQSEELLKAITGALQK